jgi:hypothetical protein
MDIKYYFSFGLMLLARYKAKADPPHAMEALGGQNV